MQYFQDGKWVKLFEGKSIGPKVEFEFHQVKTQKVRMVINEFSKGINLYEIIILNIDKPMKRFGQIIGVKPEHFEAYKKYHAAVWPDILSKITACNIQNYSIFHKDGLLFAYMEYTGDDFAADMAKMADDPKTQEWWAIMEPIQQPVENRAEGEWWANMDEVFHLD